ncbi:MAG: hypothetical protein GVY23_09705 [Spirochaetes bacterium]|jgi:hypothetical protein|nr:hypothetical protein [Spirochaetota bacterium]
MNASRFRVPAVAVAATIVAAGLLLAPATARGLDSGGRLQSQGDFEENEDPRGRFTLGAWAKLFPELEGDATAELLIEGLVLYIVDDVAAADLEYFTGKAALPAVLGPQSVLGLTAGRYQLSDSGGLVVDHRADGLAVSLDYPRIGLRLAGGYTGMLLKENASIQMSFADLTDLLDDQRTTAPPRWITQLEVEFPELVLRQNLLLGGVAQFDMQSGDEDLIDTQYGYLSLSGRVFSGFYYETVGLIGGVQYTDDTRDVDTSGVMFAGSHRFRIFIDALARSVISLRGVYASADDDDFEAYTPITQPDLITLTPVTTPDLLLASGEYSFRPFYAAESEVLQNVGVGGYGAAVFGADPTASDAYRGTEAGGRINMRPFSDIGGSVQVGVFIPEEGNTTVYGRVEFSTSF